MNLIAFDFETFPIGNNSIYPAPVCLSAYNGSEAFLYTKDKIHKFLSENLNKNILIAHNAVFECGVIITHFPDLAELVFNALDEGKIYCTKINEAIWNAQREKQLNKLDLASLVLHYFKKDISEGKKSLDAWRLRYNELNDVPKEEWPQEAIDYAIDDSIWAYKLCLKQEQINQKFSLKSAVYLNLMGAQGFKINQERVLLLEKEIWEYLSPRYDFLIEKGYCNKLPSGRISKKSKLFREYLIELGIDLEYTIKGQVSTSSESLNSYNNQIQDEIVKTFSELATYEKINSSYISHLKGADKIYSQYSTTMSTSRTSSSGSKLFDSVNIQQMPREVPNVTYDVRNCFIPREGFKICSIDYSGLELCSAAHQLYTTLGYSKMREALNEGNTPTDMHSRLAAKIKKIPYEEFIKHKSESEYKSARQKAKPINLGFPGGIGYDSMRHLMYQDGIITKFKVLETSKYKNDLFYYLNALSAPDLRIKRINKSEYALVIDELVLLKNYIYELYPELEHFLKETHNKFITDKFKYVKNEFDEWEKEPIYAYNIYGFKRDWCTYTALCNGYLMQTPSAIGAQKAVNKLMRTFWKHPDIIPQAFIHDEVVFEVKEGRYDLIEQAAYIMIDEMQTVLSSVRIAVEASVSDYWQKADGFWTKTYWKDNTNEVLNKR